MNNYDDTNGTDNSNGLVHIYCGDGKGKTTAAVGLTVRAVGAGQRVIFAQFMKSNETSELNVLKKLENVAILRSDEKFPFYKNMTDADKERITEIHNEMLEAIFYSFIASIYPKLGRGPADTPEAKTDLLANPFTPDVIVLDEVTHAVNYGLINRDRLTAIIKLCQDKCEVVITGRNPDDDLLSLADYVTEMKKIKHPFDNGIVAREGIEY